MRMWNETFILCTGEHIWSPNTGRLALCGYRLIISDSVVQTSDFHMWPEWLAEIINGPHFELDLFLTI